MKLCPHQIKPEIESMKGKGTGYPKGGGRAGGKGWWPWGNGTTQPPRIAKEKARESKDSTPLGSLLNGQPSKLLTGTISRPGSLELRADEATQRELSQANPRVLSPVENSFS